MVYQLIYLSHANPDLTYTDLNSILSVSKKNNALLDISGILIYKDDLFIQLLEGTQKNVELIFGRIKQDPRNNHIKELYRGESEKRFFGDWSMGYADGDLSQNDSIACRRLFQIAQQYRPEMHDFVLSSMKAFRESLPSVR